jgi:hypothetical protein
MDTLISLHLQMRLEGKQVVRAWARSLLEAGKVPFYSYKIENRALAGLAWRLGLQPVFEEIAIGPAS